MAGVQALLGQGAASLPPCTTQTATPFSGQIFKFLSIYLPHPQSGCCDLSPSGVPKLLLKSVNKATCPGFRVVFKTKI